VLSDDDDDGDDDDDDDDGIVAEAIHNMHPRQTKNKNTSFMSSYFTYTCEKKTMN
jgi:hypothetical protein